MSAELLPCPFCGCGAQQLKSYPQDPSRHSIKCHDCPAGAEFYSSTAEQAIAAWNRRATQLQAPKRAVTDAERSEIEELRFYKRVGFPYTDHSTMFDKGHCGYIAMTVPAHLPHPKGEGTVMGKVIHGYTVADVYAKAKAHMAEIEGAAPETPEGKK